MQGGSAGSIGQAGGGNTAAQYSQGYYGGTAGQNPYAQYGSGSTAAGAAGSGGANPYGSLQYSNGQLATGLGTSAGYSGTSNMLQQGVSSAQGLANSVYQQQQVVGAQAGGYQIPSSGSTTGQYVSQNPNPSGAFDPTTGDNQFQLTISGCSTVRLCTCSETHPQFQAKGRTRITPIAANTLL
jgi:hypothetical protein